METKTCNLTEDEIKMLIMEIGREMDEINIDTTLDRLNYFNRRLKAEKKDKPEDRSKNIEINEANITETKATVSW